MADITNKMISILIGVVIFAALMPTIATQLAGLAGNANLSGAVAVIIGLFTLFIALGFMKMLQKTSGIGGK